MRVAADVRHVDGESGRQTDESQTLTRWIIAVGSPNPDAFVFDGSGLCTIVENVGATGRGVAGSGVNADREALQTDSIDITNVHDRVIRFSFPIQHGAITGSATADNVVAARDRECL